MVYGINYGHILAWFPNGTISMFINYSLLSPYSICISKIYGIKMSLFEKLIPSASQEHGQIE